MNIIFRRIYTALKGNFDFAGKNYKLTITKVYTQVTKGRFQVDMEFDGEVPAGNSPWANLTDKAGIK